MMTESAEVPSPQKSPTLPDSQPREVSSDDLFGAAREVHIRHGDQLYRLRITFNNKLILQK